MYLVKHSATGFVTFFPSKMRITTSLLPTVSDSLIQSETAVVIDVLRATSVMATALDAGAERIITCREVDQAIQIAADLEPRPLMCGERNCLLIPGFDLGNSPAEYVASKVSGKTLVLTTTNGTAAVQTASKAKKVIAASFLNFSAVVRSLEKSETVQLICAGTDGFITAEDALLAGAMIVDCETRFGAQTQGDGSTLAKQLWESWFSGDQVPSDRPDIVEALAARLRETRGGKNLVRAGHEQDIQLCARIDSRTTVPQLRSRDPMSFK